MIGQIRKKIGRGLAGIVLASGLIGGGNAYGQDYTDALIGSLGAKIIGDEMYKNGHDGSIMHNWADTLDQIGNIEAQKEIARERAKQKPQNVSVNVNVQNTQVREQQMQEQLQMQEQELPQAIIKDVRLEHNAYNESGEKGMRVRINTIISNAQEHQINFNFYVYNADGSALRDRDGINATQNGSVGFSGERLNCHYSRIEYNGYIFIPYEQLHITDKGTTSLSLKVAAFDYFNGSGKCIGNLRSPVGFAIKN